MVQPNNKDYAEIKAGVSGLIGDAPEPTDLPEAPEAPAQEEPEEQPEAQNILSQYATQVQQEAPAYDADKIHEIAEAIVNERWEEFLARVGDLAVWKERAETSILSIKQEIIRINQRFENLQNAVVGKIHEYDQDIKSVHTEMKALEKVFEKITEPLVSNIKELGRITQELKNIPK
ncbi:MAG TPA: hypothetical protein VFE88_04325 [Candidatus Nanoarchaeia archaeon]|nr:hypothetical protein [Candidatus Nanoarchaeia archaeon]